MRVISEGSCDSKHWSIVMLKIQIWLQGKKYILKYNHVENSYFNLYIIFHSITVFIKCMQPCLAEETSLKKHLKYELFQTFDW